MKKKNLILIGLIAVMACTAVGCGGSKGDEATTDNVVAVEELPTNNEANEADATEQDEADTAEADETDEAEADSIVDTSENEEAVNTETVDSDKQYLVDVGLPTEGVVDEFTDVYGYRWVEYEDSKVYMIVGEYPVEQDYTSLDEVRNDPAWSTKAGGEATEAWEAEGGEVRSVKDNVITGDPLPEDRPRFGVD